MMGPQIAVLGAGSWGTALALQLDRSGSHSILWDRDTGNLERIRATRLNQRYLPGIDIPESIVVEIDMLTAVKAADHVLVVTPSYAFATVMKTIREVLVPGQGVAWACKGFEPEAAVCYTRSHWNCYPKARHWLSQPDHHLQKRWR